MKMNVDVQIYYKKIIDFFENNPNQLQVLIGDMNKEIFYTKIKSKVQENFLKGSDYELSKKELVDIVFELFQETNHKLETKIEIEAKFVQTKYGIFSLN
jgi:hypothetical protein